MNDPRLEIALAIHRGAITLMAASRYGALSEASAIRSSRKIMEDILPVDDLEDLNWDIGDIKDAAYESLHSGHRSQGSHSIR